MIKTIKEEIFTYDEKKYLIKVTFDGEFYIVSGYIRNILINETRQPAHDFAQQLDAGSPEIENLVHLIKDDIIDNDY
jgi:hypothetical protein